MKIDLEIYQLKLIEEVLSEKNAVGKGVTKLPDGREFPYEFDEREEYKRLRNLITLKDKPILYAEIDDIHDIVFNLQRMEVNLVVATNTPAIRNESFEKLQLVCKTIDYLDSFVEYVE